MLVVKTILLVVISIFSIGLFIAGVAPNSKAAMAITYVIYFPMLFLSGATLPLTFMPEAVQTISKALPLTYGVRLVQGLWLGKTIDQYGLEIIVLLAVFLVMGTLSLKTFRWE